MLFREQNNLKAVTFSFDDGVTQDIPLIELLNKYGLKCTFNLNSGLLGQKGMLNRNGQRIAHYKVHPKDVKEIYDGHEVAVHTLTHPDLTKQTEAEIIRQVEQDRLALSDLVGYEVVGMAYPGGGINHNETVAGIIAEHTGVRYARTTLCVDRFEPQTDLYRFQPNCHILQFDSLMEMGHQFIALETNVPQIFYIWGHAYEMDFQSDYWCKLEDFFKLISNHSDIFYGTNREILL